MRGTRSRGSDAVLHPQTSCHRHGECGNGEGHVDKEHLAQPLRLSTSRPTTGRRAGRPVSASAARSEAPASHSWHSRRRRRRRGSRDELVIPALRSPTTVTDTSFSRSISRGGQVGICSCCSSPRLIGYCCGVHHRFVPSSGLVIACQQGHQHRCDRCSPARDGAPARPRLVTLERLARHHHCVVALHDVVKHRSGNWRSRRCGKWPGQ